ncbi:MAG: right-handed parallel beta-helix repeat-containing protein [Bacteroidales bacterium]|jgi:hypothetical protein|nr:right-handed parallel beta-helix repeat-containing protein [Bacteroidales bacterium]
MKKILIILLFIILPFLLHAQLSGSGTKTSPYSGTFQGNLQWNSTNFTNGKVFIGGDVTIDNEELIIEAGMKIIFVAEGADLKITSTGQLTAVGTPGNKITFTADDDDDGIYGESTERWGHISFQGMTPSNPENYPSIIDNCIIEYGKKGTSSGSVDSWGGGVQISFSYLTISNTIIRNNFAGWGGGVFVGSNYSPSFVNCTINNNTSHVGGGGFYFYQNTASKLENCIINNNIGGYEGGGGVFMGNIAGDLRFYNCVLALNTSTSNLGKNVLFYYNTNSPSPSFYNTVVWGSNSSISYTGQTLVASDFNNCAIQDYSSGYTNCINLNSDNNNSTGPNFKKTDGTDWLIEGWSPCVDIGINNGADPDVPIYDFIGNSRIGNTDAGAYESLFYRWQGDDVTTPTVWNDANNWNSNSVPTGNEDIYIPKSLTNYPISYPGQDYTIGSGKQMIIEPGARVTLDDLTNNGTLKMNANASGLSSLVMSSYTRGTGASEDIQIYLTGGGPPNRWHYISAPISSYPVGTFTANTLDLATWIDGIQGAGSMREGWVAYDGFEYLVDDPFANPVTWAGYPYRFSTLALGKGYNFWDNLASFTYSLSGQLNTGSVNATLDFAGEDYENGFNLLGNPFTSGLDWDYILENTDYPENTSHAIYFTKDDEQYSYVSGVAVPDDGEPAPSGVIPPMQGFFVKTYQDNVVINLTSDARTHDDIAPRYKGSSIIPLVRLAITDNGTSDETVVRFAETAKTGNDMEFDALKMFTSSDKTVIYTTSPGMKYSINGQPFPETLIEIPVTVNVTLTGNHTITAKQLQGLDNYNIKLKDNLTGFIAELKSTPELSFSANTGLINDRFVLIVENVLIGFEDPVTSNNMFNIYSGPGYINIQTLSDDWDGKQGSATLHDLSGKTFTDLRNAEFSKNSITQIAAPVSKGLYVVELRSGAKRYVGKVVIR